MKGNNIDDLFRNGLGSHKITPPSAAWSKIESQLPKKSKKGVYFWLSIAASIILIFTFGWIILSGSQDSQSVDQTLQAKQDTPLVDDSPAATPEIESEIMEPITPNKQLVAQAPAKISTTTIIAPKNSDGAITSGLEEMDKLQVNNDLKEEILQERQVIELMKIDIKALPSFYVSKEMSYDSFDLDISISLEAYISSYEILTLEPSKRKKFSLLSGIVNVAKSVNSGKLALSEMRKSKNDFFNNNLKYGSKEGEPEETKQDLDEN